MSVCPLFIWELIVAFLHNLILFPGTILPDWPCLLPSWSRFGAPLEGLLSTACPAPVALNCASGLLGWGKTVGHSGTIFLSFLSYTYMQHTCAHTFTHSCTHTCMHAHTEPQCCSLPGSRPSCPLSYHPAFHSPCTFSYLKPCLSQGVGCFFRPPPLCLCVLPLS